MKHALIGLLFTGAVAASPAHAQLSVSIGINVPTYPSLVPIANYPVYYAPNLGANYFFYDGLYWVFANDSWYESPWYNGPWYAVDPYSVPVALLQVPVRYYHVRPAYFAGWAFDAAPRWGSHWGRSWESRRSGWDRWDHRSASRAPLPTYQRSYSGNRYPRDVSQQAAIQTRSYSYTPSDQVARTRFAERRNEARNVTPAQAGVQFDRQRTVNGETVNRQQRVQARQAEQQQAQQQAQRQQQQAERQQQQAQRQERQQQAQAQRAERQQQHENRGEGRGRGRDRDNS